VLDFAGIFVAIMLAITKKVKKALPDRGWYYRIGSGINLM
jgi:hypothetical protein